MANKRTGDGEHAPQADGLLADSLMVIPVDDGETGRYILFAPPEYSPDFHAAYLMGVRYEATRTLQGEHKKLKKANKEIPASGTVVTFTPSVSGDRLGTVATMRAEIAAEMVTAALKERGKPTHEANVLANVPGYLARHAAKIDAALRAKLSAGYTPTRKGEGTAKGEASVAVDDTL